MRPHMIDAAGSVGSKAEAEKKKNTKSRRTQNTRQNHGSPATATTSTQFATKQVQHTSPRSSGSTDLGFMDIDLVKLSQPMVMPKKADIHYTTDRTE